LNWFGAGWDDVIGPLQRGQVHQFLPTLHIAQPNSTMLYYAISLHETR
jgi:hypothetical protein